MAGQMNDYSAAGSAYAITGEKAYERIVEGVEICGHFPWDNAWVDQVLHAWRSAPDSESEGVCVVRLKDGRFATIEEWEDYTGHGWQCDAVVEFSDTYENAIRFCLSDAARKALGITLDAPATPYTPPSEAR